MLVSASGDHTVRLWDSATGACQHILAGHEYGVVNAVSFSPDGKMLASGSDDKTLRLWDTETGFCLKLEGHTASITTMSFSPDGKMIASGSYDNSVRLWM
jgi:WD40 repeat protein